MDDTTHLEVTTLVAPVATNIACIRFLTFVGSLMYTKVTTVTKCTLAFPTSEWPIICMTSHMFFELLVVIKITFWTVRTPQFLLSMLDLHVFCQSAPICS